MAWFVGGGMVLGLLLIVFGARSIRTARTVPWVRRRVTRPRLHGLAAVLLGTPGLVQGFFYFGFAPIPSWEIRFFGANAFMFSGLVLIAVSQMRRPRTADAQHHG